MKTAKSIVEEESRDSDKDVQIGEDTRITGEFAELLTSKVEQEKKDSSILVVDELSQMESLSEDTLKKNTLIISYEHWREALIQMK